MAKIITLLCGLPRASPEGAIGLLFECAPDAAIRRRHPAALTWSELIGDFDLVKQEAFGLARRLLHEEPALRGRKQLGIFEELVVRELQHILHARKLHGRLVADDITACVFTGASRLAQDLQWFSRRLGSSIAVRASEVPCHSSTAGFSRSWQRLRQGGFSKSALAGEWRQILERIDPFHRHACLARRRARPRHALWFYSTAYTFTRIGLLYEPYFPSPFEYLAENPLTGGLPLKSAGRSFASPYEFASPEMVPLGREVAEARDRIHHHLTAVELSPDDAAARDAYLNSPGFATFMERLLPRGLFQTCLFERFIESTEPAALVVGNPVFEGYALHAAREAGIPTLLFQHGILGDYCQFVDPPVDHYIVRGKFWRDFLAPRARERSLVLNPAEPVPPVENMQQKKHTVLFLTAPYGMQEFWNETDLDDILLALLAACHEEQADLVIRVHPMEQIGTYEAVMQRLAPQGGMDVNVGYSQGAGLDDLLLRSAVAVTFSSTAFLDCLRHKVPIVSFGWHDFSYKRQIGEHGVFRFCESLAELRRLVQEALRGGLSAYPLSTAPFMANTPASEMRQQLRLIVGQTT